MIELRRLTSRHLGDLLDEETRAWREELDWDLKRSTDLVRRYLDLRGLTGFALLEDGVAAGYVYYVLEENKGLIGDLYVARRLRSWEAENALLERAVFEISSDPRMERVESQLMLMAWTPGRPAPMHARVQGRNFMRIELRGAAVEEAALRKVCEIGRWGDAYMDAAARLIPAAYEGHVDASINDQYRSPEGARKFLHNIIQYPGCGTFAEPASFAAFEPGGGALCGLSLASVVAPACGHITQICVAPGSQGKGLGHALLLRSLLALRGMGCAAASLTVTSANQGAVRLYERIGFRTLRVFPALLWDDFRPD